MLELVSNLNFDSVEKIKKLEELLPWSKVKVNDVSGDVNIFIKYNPKSFYWYSLWWNISHMQDLENSIHYVISMINKKNKDA